MRPLILSLIFTFSLAIPAFSQPSLLKDVETERATFGATIDPSQAVTILNAVAWKHAPMWCLLLKPGGNHGDHVNGPVALDILMFGATYQIFDVFVDAPDAVTGTRGRATPSWQPKDIRSSDSCVPPVDPGAASVPAPDAPPTGPASDALTKGDLDALVDLLGQHDQEVRRLLENVYQQNERIYADLTHRLEARPIVAPPITVPDPVVPQLASGSPAGAIALFVVKYVLPAALAYVGGTKK